jgi:uncharacterized protein (DUF1800 family)
MSNTQNVWAAYEPSDAAPWNLKRVVHLHRRVVFGACRSEVERDLADGPQAAVTRVLDGTVRSAGVPAGFDQTASVIGDAAVDSGSGERLKAWWLYRCLFSPNPLVERLTLMWHNHFATSNLKVNDLALMRRQNETFRRHALAPFGELLKDVAHDPALLQWLDAPSNRAGSPNENLAREMMELFTLGVGNYTEQDIKEAARALTGWTIRQHEFRELEALHDSGSKTILGQSGNWKGDDFVRILLEQPTLPRRLAWRLTQEFFGENVVDDSARTELAEALSRNNLDIRSAVETILRSNLFFSDANLNSRISDPVSFLLMPLRALECWHNPPSTLVLAEWLTRMGQDLFYPPNVGGWNGGRTWLSTRTVVARTNYVATLVEGRLTSPARPLQLSVTFGSRGTAALPDQVRALSELVCGATSDAAVRSIADKVSSQSNREDALRKAIVEMLTRPEAQLH